MTTALDTTQINELASRMLADYDAGTPGQVFAQGCRLSLAQAWELQTAVTHLREARGERVIGYKVGCVDPGNREMMGLPHPVWGRLWASELHGDGVALKKADYDNVSIEAEFGVTLRADLKPGMSIDQIAGCIDAVYPLLELHNLVLRGERPNGHELIANNCIHCGVVRGAPVTGLDASTVTDLKLLFDGQVVDDWDELSWPNDILAAVDWLACSLAEHNLRLKAGDLVLTSAWGPPIPVKSHSRVDVTSSAFGRVYATFD